MTVTSLDTTKTLADQVRETEARHVLQTYKRTPIVLVRGEGSRVWDTEGRDYLDFTSGVGVASLGHANAGLARVIAEQATTLVHTSNLFFHPFQAELSQKLSRLSGLDRTFFCNSGTEAMEACLKFARRYWYTKGDRNRTAFVALTRAFHGRTFGSLSVTADPHYRDPFGPLVAGVTFVDPADPGALDAAVTAETAAIVLEPIQGEGGVRPIPAAFVEAVRAAVARTGALVIADEVQSGLGRTGHAFYSTAIGLDPDLISIGKALGGGIPIGAALIRERVAAAVSPGDHGSTYGGNLLACRAGLYFVDQLLDGGLLDHVKAVGAHFERGLAALAAKHSSTIVEVRGAGVIRGLELTRPASDIVDAARPLGLLANATAKTVLRLLPPLTVTAAEVDEALDRLDRAFVAASRSAEVPESRSAEVPESRSPGESR
jgi:predicted acetylornithine/succinylornithine family transaminase